MLVNGDKPYRLGVLGSGKGSNFVAIADAIAGGRLRAEVAVVLSDVADSGLLQHARERKMPAEYIAPGSFRAKLDDDSERVFIRKLQESQADLVVLAGFMRILRGEFLRAFADRIVNIHPSLLPAFPGLQAWKQALDHGVKVTGCTVHFVDHGVDSGAIIMQEPVPILPTDTAETLHARIQQVEHKIYPEAIASIVSGRVLVKGRQVWVK